MGFRAFDIRPFYLNKQRKEEVFLRCALQALPDASPRRAVSQPGALPRVWGVRRRGVCRAHLPAFGCGTQHMCRLQFREHRALWSSTAGLWDTCHLNSVGTCSLSLRCQAVGVCPKLTQTRRTRSFPAETSQSGELHGATPASKQIEK